MEAHELLKTHFYVKEQRNGIPVQKLAKVVPYIRIKSGNLPPVFVKNGGIYSEDGKPYSDVPAAIWDEARKLTPKARLSVGLVLPEEREDEGEPVAPPKTVKSSPVDFTALHWHRLKKLVEANGGTWKSGAGAVENAIAFLSGLSNPNLDVR